MSEAVPNQPWDNHYAYVTMREIFAESEKGERLDDPHSFVATEAEVAINCFRDLGFSNLQISVASAKANIDLYTGRGPSGSKDSEDFDE